MINLTEFAASTEERVLTGVKASQTMVLDGVKNTVAFADRIVPEQISDRFEGPVAKVPSAMPVVNGYFGFATKMLDAQREFMTEMVAIFQPAPAKKAPAKKAAARKTAAKKA